MSISTDTLVKAENRQCSSAPMVFIPGGTFRMGSDKHYPDEAPVHRVRVDGFWINPTPVTNRQFRRCEADAPKACCIPENPRGACEDASYDHRQPSIKIHRKVIKGGSHLCAAARHPEPVDTSTRHVGFRCIIRQAGAAP